MMQHHNNYRRAFYVVQFIELPFEGIDDYVCVPYNWLIVRKATDQKAVVAYPKDEDPFNTRDRVKRKERHDNEWKFYMAIVKYESDSYEDAEYWIATRNDYGPLVEEELKTTDSEPKFPLNKKLRVANRNHSSKLNDNPRKPLPRISIKRPALPEPNKQLDGKRMELGDAAQSSSAVVTDASAEPGSSRQEQSIIAQDKQEQQQVSQRQPQKPKIRIGISTKPKNNRQAPTLQVTKETLSPILTKVLNSVRQALSTAHNQYLQNEQQFQGNHSERVLVNENHLIEIDNTLRPPSAHHGVNSDSDIGTDHEVISDHEMSADEAPIERTNNFYGPGITSGSSCADRPIATQNSTNHQTHSRVVLEQEMLDNFATLFTQMGSTLRYTTDMYNTLRSSILDTAQTYKKLLDAVKQFNSISNNSFSINLKPEVRRIPKKRHTEVTASTSSSTQDQHSNDDANVPPKKKRNSWRFVLPSEYDPHDTKWTLKYRTNLPGLVELMPQSGVYVRYGDLKYCKQVSKDCKSLALRLLPAVFNRKALSVCLSMTERAQASGNVRSNARPELDDHACSVLLNFVIEHGLQRGWNTDLQPILSTLHSKIQEIRFKYGVVVEC